MSGLVFFLAAAAVLVTLGVLLIGVGSFGSRWREGKEGARFSNRLMRYRVIAQFVAIILIMLTILVLQSGN